MPNNVYLIGYLPFHFWMIPWYQYNDQHINMIITITILHSHGLSSKLSKNPIWGPYVELYIQNRQHILCDQGLFTLKNE